MEGTTLMLMRNSLPAVEPSRLYTRQEVAAMFALSDIELFSYASDPEGLRYEIVPPVLTRFSVEANCCGSSQTPTSYAKMDACL